LLNITSIKASIDSKNDNPILIMAIGPDMNEYLFRKGLTIRAIIIKDAKGRKKIDQIICSFSIL
tara:strand:- start:287 stop:478 length:192 start_codon:yes stop_codon:yes gene_type:complete